MDKPCIACGEVKPLDEFYPHPRMADGHLNRCKECQKANTKKAREANRQYYLAYDRARNDLSHRKEKARECRQRNKSSTDPTPWQRRNPEKRAAHIAVGNAVHDGRLVKPEHCENCGSDQRVDGHHDDYAQKLTVRWLCRTCHHSLHQQERNLPRLGLHVLVLAARKNADPDT